ESIIIPNKETSYTKISTKYFNDQTYLQKLGLATEKYIEVGYKTQLEIYEKVLPFVDGSISTLIKTNPVNDEVASVILFAYKKGFKFLYYFQFNHVGNYINMCSSCTL